LCKSGDQHQRADEEQTEPLEGRQAVLELPADDRDQEASKMWWMSTSISMPMAIAVQ
jgi:hypothetical protein